MSEVKLAGSGFICAAWKKIIEGPLDSRRTLVFRCDHPYGHKGKHLDRVLLVSWPECESDPECRPRNEWNLIGSRAPHPDHAAVEAMAQALEKIAGWFEAQAKRDDAAVKSCRFESLNEAYRSDAKNYRAMAKDARTALAAYRATQNKDARP